MNEETLFAEALKRQGDARTAFLDEHCKNDAALRKHLEGLLQAHEHPDPFLDAAAPAVTVGESCRENTGLVIGPYKLLEPIGEGGMGTVWMAQQMEPVKRLVALKLIKAGMDSKQVIARFEAERQALALMEHPNIARVLDGGTTDAGRPYFVMDLVKGVPITKYCDDHHLTPRQRLELFLPVCQAVQHAHQKGIIHRDLKPSNVLVALYDGKPVPKVIDFGVAKAAGPQLTDKTLVTGFGNIVGTLEYMSPEQAEINQLDIDTRSDIYALGVLLYELLTGSPPFSRKDLEKAGILEMLRVIREQEPSKPSTKLSTAEGLPTLAANRGTEPAKLTKLIRGELDWIVMKALEKDRNRRYETANGFAMDVQRYLADEPVQACPPSAGYRLRKFARRNKGPLAAAGLVAAALVAAVLALAVSTFLVGQQKTQMEAAYEAESRQRKRADARSEMAWRAADDMYTQVAEKWLANQPALQLVQREFLQKALAIYQEFAREDAANPAIRERTAKAHARVGAIQFQLGDLSAAELAYGRAIDLFAALVQEVPGEPRYRQELAASLLGQAKALANKLWNKGDPREVQRLGLRAFELQTALAEEFPGVPEYQHDRARTLYYGGSDLNRPNEVALDYLEQARAIHERLVARFPDVAEYRKHLGMNHSARATRLAALGRRREADESSLEAVRVFQGLIDRFQHVPEYRAHLAGAYMNQAKQMAPSEAEQTLGKAAAILERLMADHPDMPNHQYDLAKCLHMTARVKRRTGRAAEAEADLRRSLTLLRELDSRYSSVGYFRDRLVEVLVDLGALIHDGRPEEAEAAYRQVILLLEPVPDRAKPVPRARVVNGAWEGLADVVLNRGDHAVAARAAEDWLRTAANWEAQPRAAAIFARASVAAAKDSKLPEAVRRERAGAYSARADELLSAWVKLKPGNANEHNNLAWRLLTSPDARFRDPAQALRLANWAVERAPQQATYWNTLGVAEYRMGHWKAAVTALKKSMELRKNGDSFDWFFLAMAHWKLGEKDTAREWYDRAAEWMDKNQPANEELLLFRAEAAGLLGIEKKKD